MATFLTRTDELANAALLALPGDAERERCLTELDTMGLALTDARRVLLLAWAGRWWGGADVQ